MSFGAPVSLKFRRMSFDLEAQQLPKHWYADSPALSHFFSALSAVFPDGEKYFIDSVRAFEVVFEIERVLGVAIPEGRYGEVRTFKDLLTIVESLKKG